MPACAFAGELETELSERCGRGPRCVGMSDFCLQAQAANLRRRLADPASNFKSEPLKWTSGQRFRFGGSRLTGRANRA
jgi:hypothetical protein